MLYPSGAALAQINVGLSLDIYKDPAGFINSVSVYGGVWNEWWLSPDTAIAAGARSWQEMDFYVGVAIAFAQYWKVSAEYVQFNFPSTIPTAYNGVFTLSYSDAHCGLPVAVQSLRQRVLQLRRRLDGGVRQDQRHLSRHGRCGADARRSSRRTSCL